MPDDDEENQIDDQPTQVVISRPRELGAHQAQSLLRGQGRRDADDSRRLVAQRPQRPLLGDGLGEGADHTVPPSAKRPPPPPCWARSTSSRHCAFAV